MALILDMSSLLSWQSYVWKRDGSLPRKGQDQWSFKWGAESVSSRRPFLSWCSHAGLGLRAQGPCGEVRLWERWWRQRHFQQETSPPKVSEFSLEYWRSFVPFQLLKITNQVGTTFHLSGRDHITCSLIHAMNQSGPKRKLYEWDTVCSSCVKIWTGDNSHMNKWRYVNTVHVDVCFAGTI